MSIFVILDKIFDIYDLCAPYNLSVVCFSVISPQDSFLTSFGGADHREINLSWSGSEALLAGKIDPWQFFSLLIVLYES